MAKRAKAALAQGTAGTGRRDLVLAAVLAVAVLLPVVTFPTPSEFMMLDVAAALAGVAGIVGCVALAASGRLTSLRFSRVAVAWAAFMAAALASSVLSGRGWSTFMGQPTNMLGLGVLAALAAVAVAGSALDEQVRTLFERYAWMVLLAEAVLALVFAALAYDNVVPSQLAAGTLPNSTIYGMVVLLLLPWTVGMVKVTDRNVRIARWATAGIAVASLAATGARVALVAALVWMVWAVWTRGPWPLRTKALVLGAVVLAALAVGVLFAGRELASSFTSAVLGDRPEIARMTAHAVAARPLLGWGPDGFVAGGASISTVELAKTEPLLMVAPGATDPHDLLLWVAVSTGIVGLLLFAWFAVEVVLRWLRVPDGAVPAAWAVALCGVVYLTAPASLQTLPLFALMLGVSLPASAVVEKDKSGAASAAGRAPWLAPAAVAGVALASVLLTANALTRAPLEVAGPDASPRLAPQAQSAMGLWPFDAHLAYLASQHLAYVAHADPAVAESRPDLAASRRSAALDTRDPFYATELARFLQDYQEQAVVVKAAYAEVFARYPAFPIARALYAAYLAKQGDVAGAQRELAIAQLVSAPGSGELAQALAAARTAIDDAKAGRTSP